MRRLRALFIIVVLLSSMTSVLAAPFQQKGSLGYFDVTFEVLFKNSGGAAIRSINGEIPVMAWNELPPYQKLEQITADPPVAWDNDGYRVSVKIDSLPPRSTYKFDFKYRIELVEHFQDPPNEPAPVNYGRNMKQYLQSEEGVEVGAPQMIAVLSRIGVIGGTPKEKARKIFSFVSETLTYRLDPRPADAIKALETGWGRCEDYAKLFTALCRTAGIPTRLVCGFRIKPEEINSEQPRLIDDDGHMWVEVFLPGIGWVSADPTYIAMDSGRKVTDFRNFAGFYPDDLHIFLYYGQPKWQLYCQEDKGLNIERNIYVSRTDD